MNLTEQEAIAIATKVLKDIKCWSDDMVLPSAKYLDEEELKDTYDHPHWLVSYEILSIDVGEQPSYVFVQVVDGTKRADKFVSFRNVLLFIEYDEISEKYFKVDRSK